MPHSDEPIESQYRNWKATQPSNMEVPVASGISVDSQSHTFAGNKTPLPVNPAGFMWLKRWDSVLSLCPTSVGGGSCNIGIQQYEVGPVGSQAQYQSVQSAIDAAVADGHDKDDPALVLIVPGLYVEDVSLRQGIHIACVPEKKTFAAVIKGTVTCDLPPGFTTTQNFASLSGISVLPPSGQDSLVFEGTNPQKLYIDHCSFEGQRGVRVTNTGIDGGGAASLVLINDSRLFASSVPPLIVNAGIWEARQTDYRRSSAASDGVAVSVTAGIFQSSISEIDGQVSVVGTGACTIGLVLIRTSSVAVLDTTSSGFTFLVSSSLVTSGVPVITGVGAFFADDLTYVGTGVGLSPTLNGGFGPILLPAEKLVRYVPAVPGNWVGAPPTSLTDAMERLSAAFEGVHGAIP